MFCLCRGYNCRLSYNTMIYNEIFIKLMRMGLRYANPTCQTILVLHAQVAQQDYIQYQIPQSYLYQSAQ